MSLQRITCSEASPLIHECDPCNRELGRVRSVLLIRSKQYLDELVELIKKDVDAHTAETEKDVVNKFEKLIESGDLHLISETTGTFDGGSAQTGDGYGDEDSRLLGYQKTLTYKDPSYANNGDFYEAIEKEKWYLAWRTETLLHFADKPASFQAIDPVEEDLTSAVVWNVTATWKTKKKETLLPADTLAKYFDGCWADGGVSSTSLDD